jgi:hypothetical protein
MRLIPCTIEFEWVLAANGYTIVEDKVAGCPIVIANMGPLRVTHPLQEYPGLFKSFAKLEPTAASVARFANRFGLLRSDPNQNRLADWFGRSRDFAQVSSGTSASLLEASSLTHINEIIKTDVTTEIAGSV